MYFREGPRLTTVVWVTNHHRWLWKTPFVEPRMPRNDDGQGALWECRSVCPAMSMRPTQMSGYHR